MAALEIPEGFRFYKDMIANVAAEVGVNRATVAAICWQESSFNADAFRFERGYWNRYLAKLPQWQGANPRRVSSSYGLMQMMYPNIFEDHIASTATPEQLFDPLFNLQCGSKHYLMLVDWAETKTQVTGLVLMSALASYNGGRGGNDPSKDNPLRNAAYAKQVLAKRSIMEKEYGRKE